MRNTVPFVLVLAISLPPLPMQSAPTVSPQEDQSATIRLTTREVVMDFIVRDKRERLVSDLKADDVDVYEDGVKQTPRGFKAVTGREQLEDEARAKAAAGEKPAVLNPLRQINLVSILFARMSPRSREFAREAVLSFLKNEMSPNTFGAVYSLDYKLNALQVYTTKSDELKRAVERASLGAYSQYGKDNENVLNQLQQKASAGPGGIKLTKAFDPFTSPDMAMSTADLAYGEAAQFQAKALADQRILAADTEGLRSILALQTFVQRQGMLPGRKTVLYLAEGLPVPPERPELLQALIAHANTTNVSFYAIDVRGLATSSASAQARSELRNRAEASGQDPASGDQTGGNGSMDSQLLSVHADTQLSMRELAESTGGFMVANTNEITKPMQRVMEDVRTHYEVAYSPTSSNYDGRFRKVEIRVRRPGTKIQARTGYYALPDLHGEPIQPYEVAGMRVLDSKPVPNAIAFSASLLDFGRVGNSVQCVVAFQVSKSDLTATNDKSKKAARLWASLFALVKNDKGQIVGKAGKDFGVEVPADKASTLKEGDLLYSQPVALRPGHYTVETVVIDREGEKAGVHRFAVEVSQPEPLGLSSISIVRRIDRPLGDRDNSNPLEYAAGKVVPSITQRVKGGSDTGFFFIIYPLLKADGKPDSAARPEVTVSFYLDGKQTSSDNPPLSVADDSAALPVMLSARFNPGDYMMKVAVKQGERRVERRTSFQVF